MKTQFFKTFQPFINKCRKSSMPILEKGKVENGNMTISNIETRVNFKVDLPDGMYDIINGEAFKCGMDIDDYPMFPDGIEMKKAILFAGDILNYVPCVANDPLRPVMGGIHINDRHIVASDAHVLRYKAHTEDIEPGFNALFVPSAALVSRLKQDTSEPVLITTLYRNETRKKLPEDITKEFPMYVRFTFSDCVITERNVEGNYPNYESIIPDWRSNEMKCFQIDTSEIPEMVKFSKSFQKPCMVVSAKRMTISNLDLELEKTFDAPKLADMPERYADGIVMPVISETYKTNEKNQEVIPTEDEVWIGVNPEFLQRISQGHKGKVVIGFYDPIRPMGIWLERESGSKPMPKKKPQPQPTKAPVSNKVPEYIPTKEEAPETKPEPMPTPAPAKQSPIPSVTILQYSDKAIAVFGATKEFKDQFKELWGRFNPMLVNPETKEKEAGWVFSKKRTDQVLGIISKAS
jgi:hypothetical protein